MPRIRPALALLFLLARGAFAAAPVLVKDIDPRLTLPYGIPVEQFLSFGGLALYAVHTRLDAGPADELWATDGTLSGTRRLFTANSQLRGITLLDAAGRTAFFAVSSYPGSLFDARLFRTDGTAEGTFEIPGVPPGLVRWTSRAGLFYFVLNDPATGSELWRSDGTPEGTLLLRDITPGIYGSDPRAFLSTADRLWFFADGPDGTGLWSTDGSRAGTRRAALLPPFAEPWEMAAAGSRIFFTEGDGNPRFNLWTSDGTQAGTVPIPPFHRPHRKGPAVAALVGSLGERLVFATDDARSGTAQLWISDGSVDGTGLLADFGTSLDLTARDAVRLGEKLLFAGPDNRLWSTRGTRASTRPLLACHKGCVQALPQPYPAARLFPVGDRVLFHGSDGDSEPWVTDGTAEGTRKLVDAVPGPDSSYPIFFPGPPGRAFFAALPDALWVTDGTPEGSRVVSRSPSFPYYYQPPSLALAGERAVFGALNDEGAQEIRSTDGSPEGTTVLASLSHGADSLPQGLLPFRDGILFYTCVDQAFSLWRSDGTAEGTLPLTTGSIPCPFSGEDPLLLTDGDTAWFSFVSPDEFWYELWKTDGTPVGTGPVNDGDGSSTLGTAALDGDRIVFTMVDFNNRNIARFQSVPTAGGGVQTLFDLPASFVTDLTALDGDLFFQADKPEEDHFVRLWRSDGTAGGTRALALTSIYLPWPIPGFFRMDGYDFFLNPLDFDPGLWRTDGTPEGTRRAVPYAAGEAPTAIRGLARFGGKLFFIASQDFEYPPHYALYRSDGTAAGTGALAPVGPETFAPDPDFTEAAGLLFFVAADENDEERIELWRTDGTRAGTFMVSDLDPGLTDFQTPRLTVAAGRVWFAADDGEHGSELWSSDGTVEGTRLEADLAPGPASSFPADFAVAGNRLFFSADDGVTGRELWLLSLDEQEIRP